MNKLESKKEIRIAIIDDNEIFRLVSGNMMKQIVECPTDITFFDNAIDALGYFENEENQNDMPLDFLFVDINMPFMSGWELMDRLEISHSKLLKDTKIYIVSSSNSATDKNQSLQYPFINGYLTKPFEKDLLYEIFSQNCSGRK